MKKKIFLTVIGIVIISILLILLYCKLFGLPELYKNRMPDFSMKEKYVSTSENIGLISKINEIFNIKLAIILLVNLIIGAIYSAFMMDLNIFETKKKSTIICTILIVILPTIITVIYLLANIRVGIVV